MGSLAGSEAMLVQRGDGTAYAVCINKRGATENQYTTVISGVIDILLRNVQLKWPKIDLFDIQKNPLNNTDFHAYLVS